VILHNVLESIRLLAEAARSFNDRCAVGIEPNEKRIREHLDHSLMLVTALNPHIGYEKAAQISLKAYREDLTLRDAALALGFLTAEQFDAWVQPEDMVQPLAPRSGPTSQVNRQTRPVVATDPKEDHMEPDKEHRRNPP